MPGPFCFLSPEPARNLVALERAFCSLDSDGGGGGLTGATPIGSSDQGPSAGFHDARTETFALQLNSGRR
jgi:hypothetical protein